MRGVRLESLLRFFTDHCGEVVFEDAEKWRPLCQATTLARLCNNYNRIHAGEAGHFPLSSNLYAIDRLLIRQLTAFDRVSLAELWSGRAGQRIEVFVSHWWGEDFGEFCQSTYRFALTHARVQNPYMARGEIASLAKDMSFYICAFSNNQWNLAEEMGQKVEDSPFYKVLNAETTSLAVMNVDQSAGALLRAWCSFEFYFAHAVDKPFLLNTRFGPLQELKPDEKIVEVWIRHMFEVLQDMDIRKAQATKLDDLKMIQARVETFEGRGRHADCGRGAEGLNRIFKRLVANEVVPLLARSGDSLSLGKALDSNADPNATDYRGVPALTHAVALHGAQHPASLALLRGGASPAAGADDLVEGAEGAVGFGFRAGDALRMFDADAGARAEAIRRVDAQVRRLAAHGGTGVAGGVDASVFAPAVASAQAEHTRLCLPRFRENLRDDDPSVRHAAVKALGALLQRAPAAVLRRPAVGEAVRDLARALRDDGAGAAGAEGAAASGELAASAAVWGGSGEGDDRRHRSAVSVGAGAGGAMQLERNGSEGGGLDAEEDEDDEVEAGDGTMLVNVCYGLLIREAAVRSLVRLGLRAAAAVGELAEMLRPPSRVEEAAAATTPPSRGAAARVLRRLAERAAAEAPLPTPSPLPGRNPVPAAAVGAAVGAFSSAAGAGAVGVGGDSVGGEDLPLALVGVAPALAAALADDDAQVRDCAVRALGALRVRFSAAAPVEAVGAACETLVGLLRCSRQAPRDAASAAFRALGPHAAVAAPGLARVLAGSGATPGACTGDRTTPSAAQRAAARALAALGEKAEPAAKELAAALSHPDPATRLAAAEALTSIGAGAGPTASRALVRQLACPDSAPPDTRATAARLLRGLGEAAKPAVHDLAQLLSHPDLEVRREASGALARLNGHSSPATPKLVWLLTQGGDEMKVVAAATVRGLGEHSVPAARGLAELLASDDVAVRRAAAEALRRLGPLAAPAAPELARALAFDPEKPEEPSASATASEATCFSSGSGGGLSRVERALAWRVREAAATALGALSPELGALYVPNLAQALNDGDEDVRRAAAKALGLVGGGVVVPSVLTEELERRAAGDEDGEVQRAAEETLHRLGLGGDLGAADGRAGLAGGALC